MCNVFSWPFCFVDAETTRYWFVLFERRNTWAVLLLSINSVQLLHSESTLPYHNGTNFVIPAAVHTNHFLSITIWKVCQFSFPSKLFSSFSRWLILFGLIAFSGELECVSGHPLQLRYFKRLHCATMFSKPTKIITHLWSSTTETTVKEMPVHIKYYAQRNRRLNMSFNAKCVWQQQDFTIRVSIF